MKLLHPLNIIYKLNVQQIPVKEIQTLLAAVAACPVVDCNLYHTLVCPPLGLLRYTFPGIHNSTCIRTTIHAYKHRIFLCRIQIHRPDDLGRKHITVNGNGKHLWNGQLVLVKFLAFAVTNHLNTF